MQLTSACELLYTYIVNTPIIHKNEEKLSREHHHLTWTRKITCLQQSHTVEPLSLNVPSLLSYSTFPRNIWLTYLSSLWQDRKIGPFIAYFKILSHSFHFFIALWFHVSWILRLTQQCHGEWNIGMIMSWNFNLYYHLLIPLTNSLLKSYLEAKKRNWVRRLECLMMLLNYTCSCVIPML